MNASFFHALVVNAALLLALGVVFNTLPLRPLGGLHRREILAGFILGGIGLAVMLTPWQFQPGIIFDTRSIVLSLAGLFFGLVPTVIAIAATAILRISQGGAGVWMGLGVILSSGGLGLVWRHSLLTKNRPLRWGELFLFGFVVHIVMLLWTPLLPREIFLNVLKHISLPVLLVYPTVTALLAKLLDINRERRAREQELRRQHDLFQRITETSPVGISMVDKSGRITFTNRYAEQLLGLNRDTILQLGHDSPQWKITDYAGRAIPDAEMPLNRIKATGQAIYNVQHAVEKPDGKRLFLSVNAAPLFDESGSVDSIVAAFQDVTERLETEKRIRKLNRIYAVLSNINQSIVRIPEPISLFSQACRIAVEDGEFRIAMVVTFSHKADIPPVLAAQAGLTEEEAARMTEGLKQAFGVGAPLGTTLQQGNPAIMNDLAQDHDLSPCHQLAWERNCRSLAALPLKQQDRVVGALVLFTTEPAFFDRDEITLLDELAMDLAYALEVAELERQRQQSANELKLSEARYKSLFENNHAVMLLMDPQDGQIVDANNAAVRYYGWSREELRRMSIKDINILPPDNISHLMSRAHGGRQTHFFLKHRLADGSVHDVEIISGPVALDERTLLFSIVYDITDKMRLESHNQRLAAILDQSFNEIYVADAETMRFTYVNQAACRHLGYTREELLSMTPIDLEPGLTFEGLSPLLHRLRAGEEKTIQLEAVHRTKEGQTYDLLLSLQMMDSDTGPQFVGIGQDVSEHKRLEAQLRQAQKMEAVGRLAGGVAHDFNNMLGVIIGYTDLALTELDEEDPLYLDLKEIDKAARRSANLTRQLLAFSRKQIITPRVLNLNQAIENQLKMLGRLIGEDISLQFHPDDTLWPIQIDPGLVDQILTNLAVNSRDAITGIGTITIETANVTLDDSYSNRHMDVQPGDYVMLAFSDSGAGMDSATLERIFEPFFTTKTDGRGTGLGLATVYGIIKQIEGVIHAYSEPGMGTTFKIYFRRHHGEEETPIETEAVNVLVGKEVILIVEDEGQILKLAGQILERHGYTVLTAGSAAEACAVAESYPTDIHLLLTDVIMPGMSGKDLQQRIVAIKPGIRTLFMSGYTANVIVHHGVLEEGVNFIHKPFSIQELARKVRAVLDGR